MIQPERVQMLNDREARRGTYVLYWMQQAQRVACNHALEYAVRLANERDEPLVVLFGLTDDYPEANLRHYTFMLQGLAEVRDDLKRRGIQFVLHHESPDQAAIAMAKGASVLVTDRGYLRGQVEWRTRVARDASCRVVQVESDIVVPVEVVSEKEEYAAATIRKKIHKHLRRFLVPLKQTRVKRDSLGLRLGGVKWGKKPEGLIEKLRIDRSVAAVTSFIGGASQAKRLLKNFIAHKLNDYDECRSDPSLNIISHMSPYLHFGQISPLEIALAIRKARGKRKSAKEAYLEELIVRRELSMNFVYYNWDYDRYKGLPAWARNTLAKHRADKRKYVYTAAQLEHAKTHDPYWNAAQREMTITGKMHGYMRMYWGKKILEWSRTPERAFRIALHLNNKYELDGRDPNGFAGVAWCFGKHDRPWGERKIFGNVRYMNAAGLKRKFDMDAYVSKVEAMKKREGHA